MLLPTIPIPRAPGNPIAGEDYPRTWEEFEAFFPDEAACVSWLERLSWPDGFLCARCGWAGRPWRGSRRRLVCRRCGCETTVTAGTLFQGTRTPLRQWLAAAWHVSTADQGVSALRLQRALELGSYETAWMILHRLRRAMVRSGRPRLDGVVEVGRTLLAARLAGSSRAQGAGGGTPARAVVAIAVEDRDSEPGRVRMQRLGSGSAQQLVRFVEWAVEPRTVVRPGDRRDAAVLARLGWPGGCAGAAGAVAWGLDGVAAEPGRRPSSAHLPEVERRLTGWLLGTHQGGISAELLDCYLDEFTFRFNRRSARHRGLLFYRLVEEALVTPPQPYRSVAGGSAQIGRSGRR
jgi:hypothetical protein